MQYFYSLVVGWTLVAAVVAVTTQQKDKKVPEVADSANAEDASHDEAYNSIISSYYTTDPFFGANSDSKLKKIPEVSREVVSERRLSPNDADGSFIKRKKIRVVSRKMIPAPLLSHLEIDENDYPTSTARMDEPMTKIPAPLLVGGSSKEVISPKPYSDVVDGTNPEAEERARVKRMQLNGGSNQQDTFQERPKNVGTFSQLLQNSHEKLNHNGPLSDDGASPKPKPSQKVKQDNNPQDTLQTEGFLNGEMEKFEFEDDSFFRDGIDEGSYNPERSNSGFFSDERPTFGPESFNFNEGKSAFSDDVPLLPTIEGPPRPKKDVGSGFNSEAYFDIMSDLLDEEELAPAKRIPERSPKPRPNFQTPQPFQQRILQPPYEQLREFQPIPGAHKYAEPLSYRNPLDVDHNPDDVGFYQEPTFATNHRAFPKSPASRPLPSFQTPRFLDDAQFEDGFLDIPKVGVPSHFFGSQVAPVAPSRQVALDDSSRIPANFPRPDIRSELDSIPDHNPPSFVGETPFTEPFFDSPPPQPKLRPSRQSHLTAQYRDLDSDDEIYRPKRRPEPQSEEDEGPPPPPPAPMPHLPPPPEMIEMQKNSQFPVDVPKLGANIPYRPPELVFDEFHKQLSPPFAFDEDNGLEVRQKKESGQKNFFAPIRAQISPEFRVNDYQSFKFHEPPRATRPSPKRTRSSLRSLERVNPNFAPRPSPTPFFNEDQEQLMAFQLPEKPQRGSQTQEEKSNFQAIVPTERYPEGKVFSSAPFQTINPIRQETTTKSLNSLEGFSDAQKNFEEFLGSAQVDRLRPITESTGRPSPIEFHQKVASEFTSARPEEKEIIFETSSVYQNEPIQVTDPPVFRRDRELEFPTQSESFEPVHSPQFYRKSTQNAIFDPMMFKSSETQEKLYKPESRGLESEDNEPFRSETYPTSDQRQRHGFDYNQYVKFVEVQRPQIRPLEGRYSSGQQQRRSWPTSKDELFLSNLHVGHGQQQFYNQF